MSEVSPHASVESGPPPQAPSPSEMRFVSAAFPTGVVLIAAEVNGVPVGMLANSFTSVSLDPPLISVNVARTSSTWPVLSQARQWGISVLAEGQTIQFRQLSRKAPERFTGVDWKTESGGGVLLDSASATFIVSPEAEFQAGDHVIVLLRVRDLHRYPERQPLVFYGSQTAFLATPDVTSPSLHRVPS